MTNVLEARSVAKSFRDADRVLEVLHDVDLDLPAGEVAAVVGPSGSGKSTLLYVLGGLLRPDRGEVRVSGESLWSLPMRALARKRNGGLGFVFQQACLLPDFTAVENVSLPGRIAGRSRKWCESRACELLAAVGLSERAGHFPAALSGGEQQRVALCRALLLEPPVVLADEPTGSLDHDSAELVMRLLLDLARERNAALLLVTHNLEIAGRCGTIWKLERGRLEHASR